MEQFIQYLYEYQKGERIRNLGFMKVEPKMDKVEIHIYAKQLDEINGIRFKKEDGSCYIAGWESEQEETDYVIPSNRTYEKIQRQDLSKLSRKEWRLANNNFLLHGYYNYHHLLLIEDEGKTWLGVPGVYHEREQEAAEGFGFPEFIRMVDFETELLPEEKNTVDDFGYWCRQVERL